MPKEFPLKYFLLRVLRYLFLILFFFAIFVSEQSVLQQTHSLVIFAVSIVTFTAVLIAGYYAERQMWETRSLLYSALEATTDGILVVNTSGKITHFNKKFTELWRIPINISETKCDQTALEFAISQLKDPQRFIARVRELYDTPLEVSFDVLEFKDGRIFERHSHPQIFRSKCLGRVWSFRDVTQRYSDFKLKEELLEREKVARQQAENAVNMKNDFVAMISHDIRNPLSGILAGVALIEKTVPLDAKGQIPIEIIKKHVQKINHLVRDLLEIYKAEASLYETRARTCTNFYKPASLAKAAIELQQPLADEKNILIETFLNSDLPRIKVDSELLAQAFQNIIGNAIKFTPAGGRIAVTATLRASREIVFSIEDDGPGIEKELLPILFDRFAQSKKTAKLGTGLGLTIAKGIIEAHSGKIWVENTVGGGAKFSFSIPVFSSDSGTSQPQ